MKKLTAAIISAIIFTFFLSAYSEKTEKNIADNIIRLHITANSDSAADQEIKLKVRDRIIKEMSPILADAENFEESKQLVLENIDAIRSYADSELENNGVSYTSRCSLGKCFFPTKTYDDITLPPGEYTALNIALGGGEGKNWWCVMYPPMCFVDGNTVISEQNREILENNLDTDTYDLITNNGECPDIQIKFKIVEVFQNLRKH